MGLFYDDKKILAASWLLNYLSKNHCIKISSEVYEHNSYRGDVVKLSDLPKKFSYEILNQAADILSINGHINYVVKDHRIPEESKIHIWEAGRQAALSSFYMKLFYTIWAKRFGWFIGIMVALFTIYSLLPSSSKNKENKALKKLQDTSIIKTSKTN
jgi:hypothetical protein